MTPFLLRPLVHCIESLERDKNVAVKLAKTKGAGVEADSQRRVPLRLLI
jgi:hypothetical protein